MTLYKITETIWESGDPALVGIFIEDATQELLDTLKKGFAEQGIVCDSIHTILFTKIKFGIVFVEDGTFKADYCDDPPPDITEIEERCMKFMTDTLNGGNYRWDSLWYKNVFSELDEDFIGLADHVVGFTDSDVDFCYVATKDNIEQPILFFKNCMVADAETTILNGEDQQSDDQTV